MSTTAGPITMRKEIPNGDHQMLRLFGHPLEGEDESTTTFPIRLCLCVQDTPDNPCPCPDRIVVWIPRSGLLRSGEARRGGGQPVQHWYDLEPKTQVTIEVGTSLSIERLLDATRSRLTGSVRPQRGVGGRPVKPQDGVLIAAAVGWWLGQKIEEETDGAASDAVAELVHAVFGDAPDWLKDLF